jgi:hypothetical protein
LYRQPWLGQSSEGFVIEQTLSTLMAFGKRAQPFYLRTSDGHELDLVLDWGAERWAVEITLTSNPSRAEPDRLNATADLIDAKRRVLLCRFEPCLRHQASSKSCSDGKSRCLFW